MGDIYWIILCNLRYLDYSGVTHVFVDGVLSGDVAYESLLSLLSTVARQLMNLKHTAM